jgi:hypothetical protein
MQEAGGLTTHGIRRVAVHDYLARYSRLAAGAPPIVGPTKQSSGDPCYHPITTL